MECVVIDSEKAFDYEWAESIGIDTTKLTVVQLSNIVDIKQFVAEMSDGYDRDQRENIFCLLDSWGTLVSHVILKKAIEGNEAKDMSLPLMKNELANIMKESDITFYVINHVYDNTGGFGDPLKIPGGKRLYFNCDSVVLGQSRAKDKESSGDISGAIITAVAHKGRKAIDTKKLKYRIKHEGGLDIWYGLLPDALEHGSVIIPSKGYYSRPCVENDKKWREKQIYNKDFWMTIFKNTDFEKFLEEKYSFKNRKLDISEEDINDIFTK